MIEIDDICQMMYDRGIDQDIVDYIRANASKIYLKYDVDDPNDSQIMSNKIDQIANRLSSENIIDEKTLRWCLMMLASKH
jgi:hypothetical protein